MDSRDDSLSPQTENISSEGSLVEEEALLRPRKPRRRKSTIIAAVVVLIVLGGGLAAGFVWHEQPSFCSVICHEPMDPYVEGYLDDASPLLVAQHAKLAKACLECHEPEISEQVHEATIWVSGDFSDPLEKRTFGTREFCLSCHDFEEVKVKTVDYGGDKGINPHSSHMTSDLQCGDCHSMHRESSLVCNECHSLPVPEGWK